MIRITQIKISIDEPVSKVKSLVLKKLRLQESDLLDYRIYKESIDARHRGEIDFIYTVDIKLKDEARILSKKIKNVSLAPELDYVNPVIGSKKMLHRPVVIGFGPAGMFAALLLAQNGYRPIVLERGQAVDERVKSIDKFWLEGKLNPKSNVQFGEGGAGTFSDGKLTSRVRDLRGRKVLEEFVQAGAPEDILYKAHPHVGTDLLRDIVKNIRKQIIELGGEVHFDAQVEEFLIEDEELQAVKLADGNIIKTQENGKKEHSVINGYVYDHSEEDKDGNTTHIYRKVNSTTSEVNEKETSYVDENGKTVQTTKQGQHPQDKISGYEFVRTETDANGNVRHVYRQVAQSPATANTPETVEQRKNELPNTGTGNEFTIFGAAAVSILAGLGIAIPGKKKEEEK